MKNQLGLITIALLLARIASADTVDKHFIAVSAFNAGTIAFDDYTTAARHKGCSESAPILGRNPSNGRLAAVSAGQFGLLEGMTYLMKRNKTLRHVWPVPIALVGATHIRAGVHNAGLCD